jgi:hypothetical protein
MCICRQDRDLTGFYRQYGWARHNLMVQSRRHGKQLLKPVKSMVNICGVNHDNSILPLSRFPVYLAYNEIGVPMTAPDTVHELVAKFDQHQSEYQSHKNETELQREFLDPFFEALGCQAIRYRFCTCLSCDCL